MPESLVHSEGASAFEALSQNPNAELKWRLDDASGRPIAAVWQAHDLALSERALSEVRVSYHIAGSTRIDSVHLGRRTSAGVKARSLAVTGPGSFEWHLHGTIDFAQLYVWPDEEAAAKSATTVPTPTFFRNAVGARDPWMEGLFMMLLSYPPSEADRKLAFLQTLREQLIEHLGLKYTTATKPLGGNRIAVHGGLSAEALRLVQDEMQANLSTPQKVAELAALACCSESHFFRAFKESVGCSPYQYLIDLRIRVAQEHLADSTLSIAEIGRSVGFSSAAKFSAAFINRHGVSPSEYRRLNAISS